MSEESGTADATLPPPPAPPPRPRFWDEWREKAKGVASKIFYSALAFFVASAIISLLLFVLKHDRTLIAVRELVVADLTKQSFPEDPPGSNVPKMDYLAVAEAGCEDQLALDKNCEGKGHPSRSILASEVKAASQSRVKILIIDAAPSAETVCDPDTRLLLDGVSDAGAAGMIVIMPRPLSTRHRPEAQQRTYFED